MPSRARTDQSHDFASAGIAEGSGLESCHRVRLIETRVLVRREHGWDALPYVWNAAQTEAELARTGDALPLDLVGEDGSHEPFTYVVPNENQCAGCHVVDVKARAIAPIGPKARHLNRDLSVRGQWQREPARALEQARLSVGGRQTRRAPRHATRTGATRTHRSPTARCPAYLDVNCAHCHNPAGPGRTRRRWT